MYTRLHHTVKSGELHCHCTKCLYAVRLERVFIIFRDVLLAKRDKESITALACGVSQWSSSLLRSCRWKTPPRTRCRLAGSRWEEQQATDSPGHPQVLEHLGDAQSSWEDHFFCLDSLVYLWPSHILLVYPSWSSALTSAPRRPGAKQSNNPKALTIHHRI